VKATQVDGHQLLCLNQHEALMLARVFQVALLHDPTCDSLRNNSAFALFHRQMMTALACSPAALAPMADLESQVRSGDSSSAGFG